jgi:hypothetical protein
MNINKIEPPLLDPADYSSYKKDLYKKFKLDSRVSHIDAKSFRGLYLVDRYYALCIINHFSNNYCTITKVKKKDPSSFEQLTITKEIYREIWEHYMNAQKKIN